MDGVHAGRVTDGSCRPGGARRRGCGGMRIGCRLGAIRGETGREARPAGYCAGGARGRYRRHRPAGALGHRRAHRRLCSGQRARHRAHPARGAVPAAAGRHGGWRDGAGRRRAVGNRPLPGLAARVLHRCEGQPGGADAVGRRHARGAAGRHHRDPEGGHPQRRPDRLRARRNALRRHRGRRQRPTRPGSGVAGRQDPAHLPRRLDTRGQPDRRFGGVLARPPKRTGTRVRLPRQAVGQ